MTYVDTAVRPSETQDETGDGELSQYWPRPCTVVPTPSGAARHEQTRDEAFVDFVRTNTPTLTRLAYLRTGSAASAEELVQDTLVRLYPQWARVQNADLPLAYVRRALTNRFISGCRGATQREVITDTVPERPAARCVESEIVDRDEIWALLQTLSRRQCSALVLRYYEGLNDAEIADVLGARIGTVRSLISRGLATLREAAQVA